MARQRKNKDLEHDPVYKQEYALFARACNSKQDPVLTILRVHLLTEYYLERLINLFLPRGDRVNDDAGLSYHQKLALVHSFDVLNDRTVQCLKGLNKTRNRCAHEIDKAISMSEVELIGRPLGEKCTEYRRDSNHSVPIFLFHVLSFVCGHLAAEVASLETRQISLGRKKSEGLKTNNISRQSEPKPPPSGTP